MCDGWRNTRNNTSAGRGASCQLQVHSTASSSPEYNLTIRVNQHVIYVFSLLSTLRILAAKSDSDPPKLRVFVCQYAIVVARQIISIAFELDRPQNFCYLVVADNYKYGDCAICGALDDGALVRCDIDIPCILPACKMPSSIISGRLHERRKQVNLSTSLWTCKNMGDTGGKQTLDYVAVYGKAARLRG